MARMYIARKTDPGYAYMPVKDCRPENRSDWDSLADDLTHPHRGSAARGQLAHAAHCWFQTELQRGSIHPAPRCDIKVDPFLNYIIFPPSDSGP